MDDQLFHTDAKPDGFLRKLELEGEANDDRVTERSRRMLNITQDTGDFLAVLIKAARARHILAIGTSNGYATLFLADAAIATGGFVTTVERSDLKRNLAPVSFQNAALSKRITSVLEDAAGFLSKQPGGSYDFVFLDSERGDYVGWWPTIKRILKPGGLLVIDNCISHPAEVLAVIALITSDTEFTCSLVPVGEGEFLAHQAVFKDAAGFVLRRLQQQRHRAVAELNSRSRRSAY